MILPAGTLMQLQPGDSLGQIYCDGCIFRNTEKIRVLFYKNNKNTETLQIWTLL